MDLGELFDAGADRLHLSAREILFSEGEAADVMYLIFSGEAELLVSGQAVGSAGPGTILGELALIEPDEPRPYSVRSLAECEVMRIDRQHFEDIVMRQPQFAVELMRVMAAHLRRGDLSPV